MKTDSGGAEPARSMRQPHSVILGGPSASSETPPKHDSQAEKGKRKTGRARKAAMAREALQEVKKPPVP